MFETEKVQRGEEKDIFNIYKEGVKIAEVRGTDPQTQQVIPMHDLNDYEENKLRRIYCSFRPYNVKMLKQEPSLVLVFRIIKNMFKMQRVFLSVQQSKRKIAFHAACQIAEPGLNMRNITQLFYE